MTKRAIIFIDANNWYHAIKYIIRPSKIDIIKIANTIARKYNLDILEIRWYASMPNIKDNKSIYTTQRSFLSKLKKEGVKVIVRKLQKLSTTEIKKKREQMIYSWNLCNQCKETIQKDFLNIMRFHQKEKGIDVKIAIDMTKEAMQNNIDCAILISGDSDFIPACELVQSCGKEVLSCFIERGYAHELRQKFKYYMLTQEDIEHCSRNGEL